MGKILTQVETIRIHVVNNRTSTHEYTDTKVEGNQLY